MTERENTERHEIDLKETKTLSADDNYHNLSIKEMTYIKTEQNPINDE